LLGLACAGPVLVVIGEKQHVRVSGGGIIEPSALLLWPLFASAAVMVVCIVVFFRRTRFARPTRIAGVSAALAGAASLLYAAIAIPFIQRSENIRPLAASIDSAVPVGARLYLFDPEYQPAIFYLRCDYAYAPAMKDLPADAEYVLARRGNIEKLQRERPGLTLLQDFGGAGKSGLLLLRRK
jgi:hypothetical protein